MNNVENIISEYTDKYGEWQEMLGDKFPEFLLRIMANDLDKAQSHNEFLKKVHNDYARR